MVIEAYVHRVGTCKVDDLVAALGAAVGSQVRGGPDLRPPTRRYGPAAAAPLRALSVKRRGGGNVPLNGNGQQDPSR